MSTVELGAGDLLPVGYGEADLIVRLGPDGLQVQAWARLGDGTAGTRLVEGV